MLNHISIAVNDPEKVANVLAEIWDGLIAPFPPAPGSFIVLANDGKGSGVELTPAGTVLVPGEGLPAEEGFSSETKTEKFEAKFVRSDFVPKFVATHLNINTKKGVEEIKAIGAREGWRTLVCNRGEGMFQLIELWVENTFMLEVMTPEMTERYIEITQPEFVKQAFEGLEQIFPSAPPAAVPSAELNLIG